MTIKVGEKYFTVSEINEIVETLHRVIGGLWSDNEISLKENERAVLGIDELEDLEYANNILEQIFEKEDEDTEIEEKEVFDHILHMLDEEHKELTKEN